MLERIVGARTSENRKRDEVQGWLEASFADLTEQQFLYDTREIDALLKPLWSCLALYGNDGLSARSRTVLFKLLAHESYGKVTTSQIAISLMMRTEALCAEACSSSSGSDARLWRWYRVFLLDHAANRMSEPEQAAERARSNQAVESMLTSALQRPEPGVSIGPDDAALLLRAAHYWGHRGNYALSEVQTHDSNRYVALEPLIESGVTFFGRAIRLRLVAYQALRQQRLSSEAAEGSTDAVSMSTLDALDRWDSLKTTSDFGDSDLHVERLQTDSQGISDLANQFAALACLHCHRHALTRGADADALLSALSLSDLLWREANRRVRNSHGRYYRTIRWKRLTEHMLYGVKHPQLRRRAKPVDQYEDPLDDAASKLLLAFQARNPWST